jgi:dynein heavy chain
MRLFEWSFFEWSFFEWSFFEWCFFVCLFCVSVLYFSAEQVSAMQKELTAMLPSLAQAQVDTDALMVEIEEKLPGVKIMEKTVGEEAAKVQIEADKCSAMKKECEDDLAEAIPLLESALAALNTLKKSDTDEVKNFKKPSATVVLIISAVCDMMEVKPGKADDPDNPGTSCWL